MKRQLMFPGVGQRLVVSVVYCALYGTASLSGERRRGEEKRSEAKIGGALIRKRHPWGSAPIAAMVDDETL